jgi:putative DNA primase/helicase
MGAFLSAPLISLDLSPDHRDTLIAIDPVRVQERQYRTIPPQTAPDGPVAVELNRLGFAPAHVTHACRVGALVIPGFDTRQDIVWAQLRGNVPFPASGGRTFRYTGPKDAQVRLDFGPTPTDAEDPLWITEGVKKADALATLGLRAVAMPGVWNWHGNGNGSAIHPDMDALPKGMTVRIVFDADTATKPNVAQAQERLVAWLRTTKNADVAVSILPGVVAGVPVKGIDDHIAAGFTLADLEATLTVDCPKHVDVAAQERAVAKITASVEGTNPEDVVTDARMGHMIATELFPGRFRWANGAGWMHWDGCRWAIDGKNDKPVNDLTRIHLDAWYKAKVQESAESGAARSREGLRELQVYRSVLSRTKRDAVLRDASAVEGVRCDIRDFDDDPDVLNTPTGLLDLRTGVVSPRTPDALVTKVTGVDYVPGTRSPLWEAALVAIPAEIRGWMQLRLGEALSGHITHDAGAMFWLGGGGNGKSTLLETIMTTLGDYAGTVSPKLVAGSPNDHPTEIMTLRGLRVAVVEELPEGKILNVTALKRIQGVGRIMARYTYQDNTEIRLSHALIVASNYDPIVTETDDGTWRRLIRVPFPYKFVNRPEHDRELPGDASLMARLRSDQDAQRAALAWMVEGAVRYHAEYASQGLPVPHAPMVEVECDRWRRSADPTYAFTEDHMVWDPNGVVSGVDLLSAYNAFLMEQGMNKVSARTLKDRVSATAVRAGHARTVAGPVVKWVTTADVSRPPTRLVPEPTVITTSGSDSNPFAGGTAASSARANVRVYTGLRFRTTADDAADSAADAAAVAAAESGDLVHAAELITASAATTGTAVHPAFDVIDDRDQEDDMARRCVEDGCAGYRDLGHDRCQNHIPWCAVEGRKCFGVSASYPAPGMCDVHAIEGDDVECPSCCGDDPDTAFVPSVSPLCRLCLSQVAEDAFEDYDDYLRESTPLITALSHAVDRGTPMEAHTARESLARWWVSVATRHAA